MSTPSKVRAKVPARLSALFRRWHWKDAALAVLTLLLVAVSGFAFRARLAAAASWFRPGPKAEQVAVFDVVMDRKNRAYVDVLFDRPLGQGRVGEVLEQAPAKIAPALTGFWKWQDTNALRFQPSGGFPIASEYLIRLLPERLLKPGQEFHGDTELKLVTDRFLVERVVFQEEPAIAGKGRVVLRGTLYFNYGVRPETLAGKMTLADPEAKDGKVAVELETGYQAAQIGFHTAAVQKKKEERKLRLVIAGDLTPAEGNVALGQDYVQEIPLGSSEKLAVWDVTPEPGDRESTVRIRFSSPVSAAVAEKYVRIDPAVKYRPSADRNVLSLTGEFRPGSTYKIVIGKGMPATDDAVLQADYEGKIELPDLQPEVKFQSPGMFLSAAGNHTVAIDSVNVGEAELTIDRVYLNNLFFLFNHGGFYDDEFTWGGEVSHALGSRVAEEKLTLRHPKNRRVLTPLTLGRHAPEKPGLYRVCVGKPGADKLAQRWLLLTDLGAVAKSGKGEFLVWVSSFRDLAAVEGAKVTLLSDQNQPIGSGRTDAQGIWRLTDAKAFEGQQPYMVTIEKGDDWSFLLLGKMRVDPTGLDVGGAETLASGYTAFLYGERDIYRPGEKLKGIALVRDAHLKAPPRMPLLLTWKDPQGRERGTQKLRSDERGAAEFHLDLPGYALTGANSLELSIGEEVVGQYRFQVEEFVPDRIKVEIARPGAPVLPGQPLAFQVGSAYLFGPPAAGLPVEARVRLVDASFSPQGFEGFTFRNAERQIDEREILSQQGALDEHGQKAFTVTMPAGAPVPSGLEAVLTARVQEQGGRGVSAMARVPVHAYPYYLGLKRLGEGYPDPGQRVELAWVAVAPPAATAATAGAPPDGGRLTASGPLRAELFRDRWNTVLKKSAGGYTYESTRDPELVDSLALPAGKERGTFGFAPRQVGSYRVVLTDPGTQASTEVEFYVSGWGYSPWAVKNPSRLEIDLDKEEYAPGDTAQVQVRAPFPGKLLLTVERGGVLYTSVHTLTGNTAKIAVPVTVDFRPNAYVTATLVRPVKDLEPGSVGRSFGAVPISVDRTANRLTVAIASPKEIRPGTKLQIGVKVTGAAAGTGDKADGRTIVTVAAVDEGILQLIDQKTPRPFDFFYRKLALQVTSYDAFSLLLPEVKPEPAGGGEGEAQHVRTAGIRRAEPVAFWSGPVTADAAGNARVSFDLPEFQGALRIMAVAVRGSRFGSADGMTRVRDPLVLLPTFPRILSLQETLSVPVTVRNDTGRDGAFQVALAAQGPVQVAASSPQNPQNPQTVQVPVGHEKTIYFTVRTADAVGDARFVLTAQGNGQTTRATAVVTVRPDLPVLSHGQAGAAAAAVTDLPAVPAGRLRPETVRRELRIGPVPLVQFAGKLRDLLNYPYGCLEQTVSTAFPLLYLGELAQQLDPELLDPKKGRGDPAAYVQEALVRISSMQVDGGFSLWPGGETVHPWGTAYAAHFLVEARRAGHPVPDYLYDGALGYLAGDAKSKSDYGSDELERIVYELFVLARAGKADLGTMDFLRQKQLQSLHPESRALLAAGYAAVGNPQALAGLLANLGEVERVERQTGGNFNSVVRNQAIVLLALLDAAPADRRIPGLVDSLARGSRDLGAWTTQESGWTLLALGQLFRRQAKLPAYSGTVLVGGKPAGTFTNQTVTFRNLPGDGPIRIQMNGGYAPNAAFYSLVTRGVPTDDAFAPSHHGLEIDREILDRSGKPADLNEVRQGDLLVLKTRVRSVVGAVENVVIENLLPSGIEVENPRLKTTETLPWVTDAGMDLARLDLRDDRILVFANLPANFWVNLYTLARAVAPGSFRLPPAHAEAMYNPALQATAERGRIQVKVVK